MYNYEYWTWWVFYLPLTPLYIWHVFKTKSVTFFTNVNPGLPYGGFFGSSKMAILNKIDNNFIPKTIFLNKNSSIQDIQKLMVQNNIDFPIICKPDIGERGTNVEKVENLAGLKEYINRKLDFIIQEYIDFEVELAVLYFRKPSSLKGTISSITQKQFLTVIGDGKKSIKMLMEQSDRARFQLNAMKTKMGDRLQYIPAKNEELLLEPIGNHCRGTIFLERNILINNDLENIFDNICKPIDGFYYGRFDLRVKSLEDFQNGKNIKIVELNGVNADPAHIFDPNYKLLKAYKDVAFHWSILADISLEQLKLGIKPIPLSLIWPVLKGHFLIKTVIGLHNSFTFANNLISDTL